MKNIFMKRVQKSTSLCMELTEEITLMRDGQSPDYDYALSLVQEIHKSQMELLNEMYAKENEYRVEIPEFMKAM